MTPEPIRRFADLFSRLPSLGPRQATRLAYFIASKGKAEIKELAESLAHLGEMKSCPECFARFTARETSEGTGTLCGICSSKERAHDVIAIVERDTDRLALEATKKFSGRYIVLGEMGRAGALTADQKLRLEYLKSLITKRSGKAKEIILAISPTSLSEIQAEPIVRELTNITERITKLGRGLPSGGEIEFADEDTLGGALESRR